MTEFLEPQFIWPIIGIVLLLLEFVISGLITVFFGLGALVVGLACWWFEISFNAQLVLFISTSILLLVFLRKSFKRLFEGGFRRTPPTEQDFDEFVGQKAVVTKEITPLAVGKVEFHGSDWRAEALETIALGAPVEIVDRHNITLIVKPL